nr:hypothetical protein [Tanacetum cinerariifolium]
MFLMNRDYLNDEYVAMTRIYFIQYTGQAILEFRDILIQHLESVKKSTDERVQLKRETESKEQDTSSRSGNDAHDDDADIRPIYNEEPMAENKPVGTDLEQVSWNRSSTSDVNRDITVTETFHLQTDDELSDKELKQIEVDDQAIQNILFGLPEDIYAAVDSCETAQEIWLRVQLMMKGSDIGIQEKKAKLFNKWERFTSN